MLRNVVVVEQRHAALEGADGEVFGELTTDARRRDDVNAGDDPLDLAPDVGSVPGRAARSEPGQDGVGDEGAVDAPDRRTSRMDGGRRWPETELTELLCPAAGQLGAIGGDDLVGTRLCPRPAISRT